MKVTKVAMRNLQREGGPVQIKETYYKKMLKSS